MSLGIALLGTGRLADHACAPRHAIPAVCDERAALLRRPQVDAVMVATPDATHDPHVIAAAQAGKPVLCAKPMTTTVAGCQRLAAVRRASGMTCARGSPWRFHAGARAITALLEAGAMGPGR